MALFSLQNNTQYSHTGAFVLGLVCVASASEGATGQWRAQDSKEVIGADRFADPDCYEWLRETKGGRSTQLTFWSEILSRFWHREN